VLRKRDHFIVLIPEHRDGILRGLLYKETGILCAACKSVQASNGDKRSRLYHPGDIDDEHESLLLKAPV
jgi:hypothetical protein